MAKIGRLEAKIKDLNSKLANQSSDSSKLDEAEEDEEEGEEGQDEDDEEEEKKGDEQWKWISSIDT